MHGYDLKLDSMAEAYKYNMVFLVICVLFIILI